MDADRAQLIADKLIPAFTAGYNAGSYQLAAGLSAVLEALVASGWRREADVLREAAEHLRQREREMVERGRHSTQGPYPKPMLTGVTYAADVLSARASEAEQYVSAGTREGEDQKRDEEQQL